MSKQATATLMGHNVVEGKKLVRTIPVTVKDLAKVPTPEETKYWHPVAHKEVPNVINQMVKTNGWEFVNNNGSKFQMVMTETGSKLFGVCLIRIPEVDTGDDMQIALGFRNSHDKTLALNFAAGSHVSLCTNLMVSSDVQVKHIHTPGIDPLALLEEIFKQIPGAAKKLMDWMKGLKNMHISVDQGVSFLAEAVERKALPILNFMDARNSYLLAAKNENPEIQYGDSLWAVYNAITEQWKKHLLLSSVQDYSGRLNSMMSEKTGLMIA